jgi:hypothetical protein
MRLKSCSSFSFTWDGREKLMELILVIAVLAAGLVGFCSMVAAFALVVRAGGWQQAMKPTADGRWRLPRRLMFLGAILGALFGVLWVVLTLIPGGIPWMK